MARDGLALCRRHAPHSTGGHSMTMRTGGGPGSAAPARAQAPWGSSPAVPTPDPPAPALSWTLLLVALGVLAWARVFTTGFAQDDFRWLLRASGHEAAP